MPVQHIEWMLEQRISYRVFGFNRRESVIEVLCVVLLSYRLLTYSYEVCS